MNTEIRVLSPEEAVLAKLCNQELAGVLATNGDGQIFSFTDQAGNIHAITL